ncbi:glycosyltransferase family 4 protein [Candidatus Bathyarchaeota archaeon]|jgi:glycosyltransferase involved in cell wall biosynthesis|nr:glycosyltransferase family 4 protein [Candidatus Bathyarchaeota archaeon]
MPDAKKKILMISDHALSTSGVGVQSRHLINGLIEKGEWTVRQLGAAIKHADYNVVQVNPDFIIKPIDGFGNRDMMRMLLAQEKPDVLFIFTDPRFFIWLFEMEDEVHQVCPIVWWHVWDNYPIPKYNYPLYESTDAINCHSHLTYKMCSEGFPEKTRFIPHALPTEIYFPLPDEEIQRQRRAVLGADREDHFVAFWINRNAKRKRPNDLLAAWARFLELLEEKHGHRKATLLMHTDPLDREGPNLFVTTENLGIINNVYFSRDRLQFEQINVLHNLADIYTNISFAEGFGLGTLEAMQCGVPIVCTKTGGMTRQVVDHRDGSEHGIGLEIELQTIVGSQQVPYIYEDYVSIETIAQAYLTMYEMGPEARKALGQKARDYVLSEFTLQKTIDDWHDSLNETLTRFHSGKPRWTCETL